MRRLIAATSIALTCALAPVLTLAATAGAASIRMHDPVGDDATGRGHGDIKWMRARYGAHRLSITIKAAKSGDVEFFQDIYVDTRRAERRPDLMISTNGDWEGWEVGFVSGWQRQHWHERCAGRPGSADYDYPHHLLRFSLPRTCLRHRGAVQPKRIRLSLVTRTEWGAAYDWVPAQRGFGRWLHWK